MCYRRAGFKHVGETKGGLLAFQLRPHRMPEPAFPMYAQADLLKMPPNPTTEKDDG